MESSRGLLTLSRLLRLIILLGVIGIAASPPTSQSSMYPIYDMNVSEDDFILSDAFPMQELIFPFADKIVIEELVTNGSAVVIELYETYYSNTSVAGLRNVTRIQDVCPVGIPSEYLRGVFIRISRQDNQSVLVTYRIRTWHQYASTDNIWVGPSVFMLLALPLIYPIVKNRGQKLTSSGHPILLLLVMSGLLTSPILVYTYNGGSSLLRHDEVLTTQTYSLVLNASDPVRAFNVTVESVDSGTFTRIANFSTSGTPVGLTVLSRGVEVLGLTNLTALSRSQLQFEFPRDSSSGYAIQFSRLAQDTTVSLSLETVRDVWEPWIDPVPYYASAIIGLALFAVALALPDKHDAC